MYNLQKIKPKNSTIYTPKEVSEFIFELLRDKPFKPLHNLIYDPCSGTGNLLEPWKKAGYDTWGNDIDQELFKQGLTNSYYDFLNIIFKWSGGFSLEPGTVRIKEFPKLVICNPPFNGMKPKLAPELWLDKIIELFGKDVPIVLFAPIRMRLCSQKTSPRYQKWTNGTYPPISSIISLTTKDTFPKVDFFSEILIFNIQGLEPHYFFKPHE